MVRKAISLTHRIMNSSDTNILNMFSSCSYWSYLCKINIVCHNWFENLISL